MPKLPRIKLRGIIILKSEHAYKFQVKFMHIIKYLNNTSLLQF